MNRPLRVVIVDDEPLALRRLEIALSEVQGVEIVGRARDGEEGLGVIADTRPDLVFLDVRMPSQSGLDLAGALATAGSPAVVFVTAYGRYATDAFDLAAVDYLLKPVEFARLKTAVDRARARLEAREAAARLAEMTAVISALREETDPVAPRYENEIWITDRGARVRVPVEDIDCFEAERDYVRIHTDERSYLVRTSIRSLTERLDPSLFTRVHRSFLVQFLQVERIVRKNAGASALVLRSGREIPVGRRFQPALRERFRP
jgi:DNA-binding LytR/AlgR family response regulator